MTPDHHHQMTRNYGYMAGLEQRFNQEMKREKLPYSYASMIRSAWKKPARNSTASTASARNLDAIAAYQPRHHGQYTAQRYCLM